MKGMKYFLALLFCLLPSLAFAGTAHYVDCSAGKMGVGVMQVLGITSLQ